MLHIESIRPGPAEEALYRELFAPLCTPLSTPVPPTGGDPSHSPWTEPSGVLAARDNGDLLAWVVYFALEPGSPWAVVQWIAIERERQRISTGLNTEHPATPTEIDTLTALTTAAAGAARAAGYTQLRWQPAEPGFAEGIAERLHAHPVHEDGCTFYHLPLPHR